ncbi:MAG: trigger factor family protein [Planctomycetes bacterium]|nr:trigger factor family protein [Planctomycetota bacterium]
MGQEKDDTIPQREVSIEDIGPCKKKVIVQIPQRTIQTARDEQYRTLQKDAVVPGFRKGRAPRRLL